MTRKKKELQEKLDAMGRLAGGIAHDFNNILGAIQMYCDMLPKQMDRPEKVIEGIQQIQKATERAAALNRQLLLFSRRRAGDKKPIQLNDLLNEYFRTAPLPDNVVVDFKLGSVPVLQADRAHIEQIVTHLVVNACDAMAGQGGGRLSVETSYAELNEGPRVLICIADTGCGMNDSTCDRIFEPFFTTKPAGKGVGMGLSVVYGIVQSLAGSISVDSEPGHGSVFRVYIPCSALSESLEGRETILIVEDESQVLFAESLVRHGYTILLAENERAALDMVRDPSRKIDMVLGGEDLVREIPRLNAQVCVLCVGAQERLDMVDVLSRVRKLLDARAAAAAVGKTAA